MGNDEGIWNYIGRIWIQNSLIPYKNSIENKTPIIFELHAISYYFFGVGYKFIRFINVIFIVFSSFYIYLISKIYINQKSSVITMIIFGFSYSWHIFDGFYTGQTETLSNLFEIIFYYKLLKYNNTIGIKKNIYILYAGIFIGLAISIKQIALITLLFFSLFFLYKNIYHFFIFLFGVFISILLTWLPLYLSGGTIFEYINGAWFILLQKGSYNNGDISIRFYNLFQFWFGTRITIFYFFIIIFILIFKNNQNKYKFLIIWLLINFFSVNLSGNLYGHQIKQIIPIFAILTGLSLSELNIKSYKFNSSFIYILVFLLFFPFKEVSWMAFQSFNKTKVDQYRIHLNKEKIDEYKDLGIWIKDNSNKNDYIYILGNGGNPILAYSERISCSKYFNSIFITNPIIMEKVYYDIITHLPKYFLIPLREGKVLELYTKKTQNLIKSKYKLVRHTNSYKIYLYNNY